MDEKFCKAFLWDNLDIENCINLANYGFDCICVGDEQCVYIYDGGK